MSTITRELAKLFRKITNSEIDAEGNAHVVLSPADSLLINNARIALASLEAEPVAWLLSGGGAKNNVSFDSGNAYADPLREVTPLYTASPAPVSVPDLKPVGFLFVSNDGAVAYSPADWPMKGFNLIGQIYGDVNACRAAMLQGAEPVKKAYKLNSPVIPDGWVLVPVEPTEDMIVEGFESEPDESFSDEKEWEAYDAMSGCQQAAHRATLCWAAMIAAAPKPEVK